MFFKPKKPKIRRISKDFRWKESPPNPAFDKGRRRIKQFFSQKRGEAATALTLVAVALMTIGIFAGSRLAQKDTDIRSRAQTNCLFTGNPTLTNGGKCRIPLSSISSDYVCALIYDPSPNIAGGEIVVAGQNPDNWGGIWIGTTAEVPLYLQSGQKLDSNKKYKLVAWNFVNPTNCVKEQEYDGSKVIGFFGSTSQPTPTPTSPAAPTPTSQTQPSSCTQMADNRSGGRPAGVKTETDKIDTAGACNPACCEFNGQCPSEQQCNAANGYCQSGFSCGPDTIQPTATPTPVNTPTPTPTPIVQCETSEINGYCNKVCKREENLKALTDDYGCRARYGAGYNCCVSDEEEITPPPTYTPTPTTVPPARPIPPNLNPPANITAINCNNFHTLFNDRNNVRQVCFNISGQSYCLDTSNIQQIKKEDLLNAVEAYCDNEK